MAAKKKAKRRPAGKRVDLHKLSKNVRKELRELRSRHAKGTLTRRELAMGLREINKDLDDMFFWIYYIVDKRVRRRDR